MKKILFVLAALAQQAYADPPAVEMKASADLKDWTACVLGYSYGRGDGLSDDTKVAPLAGKVDTLDAGATPTVKDLAAACLAEAKRAPDAKDKWMEEVSLYVGGLQNDVARLQSGENPDYDQIHEQAKQCNDVLDYAVQILDPTTEVDLPAYQLPDWKGTLADSRQICASADKIADQAKQTLLAPFVKVGIKGDKLDTIAAHITTYFQVKGGETTDDPKKLAKSNVLFLEWDGGACAAGEITSLERFQFDKKQKLVKSSSKDYCGTPPKSAFK